MVSLPLASDEACDDIDLISDCEDVGFGFVDDLFLFGHAVYEGL